MSMPTQQPRMAAANVNMGMMNTGGPMNPFAQTNTVRFGVYTCIFTIDEYGVCRLFSNRGINLRINAFNNSNSSTITDRLFKHFL